MWTPRDISSRAPRPLGKGNKEQRERTSKLMEAARGKDALVQDAIAAHAKHLDLTRQRLAIRCRPLSRHQMPATVPLDVHLVCVPPSGLLHSDLAEPLTCL